MGKSFKKYWHLLILLVLLPPLCSSAIIDRDMEFIQFAVLPVLPYVPYVQIVLSILLIAAILLQQRGSSLGGAFGGDNFSATFHKRRGGELFLFRFSIAVAVLFVLSALLTVIF